MKVLLFCALVFFNIHSHAKIITFEGDFLNANDVELFKVTTSSVQDLNILTTSYYRGGFDPVLGLFDGAGNILYSNDDFIHPASGYRPSPFPYTSPSPGLQPATPITFGATRPRRRDAHIHASEQYLPVGSYTVALTQYPNLPPATLAEGFVRRLAADDFFSNQLLPSQALIRTHWGLRFDGLGIDTVTRITSVPAPSVLWLALIGVIGVVGARKDPFQTLRGC